VIVQCHNDVNLFTVIIITSSDKKASLFVRISPELFGPGHFVGIGLGLRLDTFSTNFFGPRPLSKPPSYHRLILKGPNSFVITPTSFLVTFYKNFFGPRPLSKPLWYHRVILNGPHSFVITPTSFLDIFYKKLFWATPPQ
jgi:hypothetical protein